jgi:hypothetical protein
VTETGRMEWVKHIVYMTGIGSSYKIFIGKIKGKRPHGKIIVRN